MLAAGPATGQSDEEKARAQLQQLQRDIAQINREIRSAEERRGKLQQQLRDTETRLGALQRDISENRAEVEAARRQLVELKQRRVELEAARAAQQESVIAELRAAWQMGSEAQLKVLLSQQNPHTVSRMLAYYSYFFAARSDALARYRETLDSLAAVERDTLATTSALTARQQQLQQQEQQLEDARTQRAAAVASLSADIREKGGRLQALERDRAELQELLRAIEEAVVNLQVPDNYQPFAAARGAMPWPLQGKPSNRYGLPRNEGKMRWQGLVIPAREGTRVAAIHHGRVVYADWFRGSGLLLIVDHGDGYMSLYAHNQSLLREVGEWVTAGTPIATVGNSGGREQPALYFEVRKDGKPVDPGAYLR